MVNFISLTLKESIINSSQLFMSPFSADSLRNCLFRLLNNCDCYKFTTTPTALNMELEHWPPAAISLTLCLSFTENHTALFISSVSAESKDWNDLQSNTSGSFLKTNSTSSSILHPGKISHWEINGYSFSSEQAKEVSSWGVRRN